VEIGPYFDCACAAAAAAAAAAVTLMAPKRALCPRWNHTRRAHSAQATSHLLP